MSDDDLDMKITASKACYCGQCSDGVIDCTQWDCPGAKRSHGVVSHDYDCSFCDNRRKAYLARKKKELK